ERFDILERDLRDIISREPNNADALNALGYTLADRMDRYQEALKLVERAYELKPNDHYIIDSMGWVLFRVGRYDEAEKHLRRALELSPDAEIAAHLGEVLWVLGRQREAREVWDTALQATPNDKRLLEVIDRLAK
ncbi:MAG: tetratricopeptide repeat protein, partial [Gammaproteobacteria bacterium]|nr:tetratricopeptide repeat protein [Gammaproteobacteria bacterium]